MFSKIKRLIKFLKQFALIDQTTQQLSHYKAFTCIGFVVLTTLLLKNMHDLDFYIAYGTMVFTGHLGNKLITLKNGTTISNS